MQTHMVPKTKFAVVLPLPEPDSGAAFDGPVGAVLLWLARGLALAAAGVAAYLLWAALLAGGAVVGCGGDAGLDCGRVLASRWSRWLGLPVSLFAVATYGLTFLGLLAVGPRNAPSNQRDGWCLLLPLAAAAAGSAGWFLALQALVLHAWCSYCIAVHVCGLLLAGFVFWFSPVHWRRPAVGHWHDPLAIRPGIALALVLLGLAGVGLLIGGQLLLAAPEPGLVITEKPAAPAPGPERPAAPPAPLPAPPGPERTAVPEPAPAPVPPEPDRPAEVPGPVPAAPGAAAVPAAPARRQLALVNGSAHLDVEEHPRLGPAQAPHVVALLFDYTCSSCRAMHPYLVQARQRYGAQLAVVLLPVPMDPACNPFVQTARPGHENACRYARLALAVWKVSPAAFEAFHQWLMEPAEVPALAAAHDRAAELVGAEALDRALADGELDRQLATICRVYEAAGKGLIPKLVYDRGTATGKPAHAQELFDFFEKVVGARGPVR